MIAAAAVVGIVALLAPLVFLKRSPLEIDYRVLGAMGALAAAAAAFITVVYDGLWAVPVIATVGAITLYVLGLATKNPVLHIIAFVVGVFGSLVAEVWFWVTSLWGRGPTIALGSIMLILLLTAAVGAVVFFLVRRTRNR